MNSFKKNTFIRTNAESKFGSKLCDKYEETKDDKIKETIQNLFHKNSNFIERYQRKCSEQNLDVNSICKCCFYQEFIM